MDFLSTLKKMSPDFQWIGIGDRRLPSQEEISLLSCDSRKVIQGGFYLALSGGADSLRHREEAAQKGAQVIGGEATEGVESLASQYPHILWFTHPVPRRVWAWAASLWYPLQPPVIGAVTGTNGKTSVASFTRQLWSHLGEKSASLGTVGVLPLSLAHSLSPSLQERLSLTTPSPLDLHQCLQEMAQKSVTHVALEASSHGLHQERLAGLKISAAGFTNLTQDHLDYHGTMTAYLQAKSLLFDRILPSSGTAILNQDQSCFPGLQEISRQRCQALLTYSTKGDRGADLRVVGRQSQDLTQPVSLEILGKPYKVPFPLRGGFQLENALCALGLVLATGGHEEKAVAGLAGLTGEAGRLEFIGTTLTGGAVFVDFAHTPDSLQRVLEALRPITWGKLWIVFGCGGNRDSSKRGLMGQAAAEGADEVIVTDDNPRFEDPAEIRRQTRQGCPNAMEIGDRAQAIETAISQLGPGDSLVIAGKGHERGQMIGSTLLPFQDSEVARQILGRLKRDR